MTSTNTKPGELYHAPPDWYTPTLPSDQDADLTIWHDHEFGTTLTGSHTGDGVLEIVQRHHFIWRRGSGIHIPSSRDRLANLYVIEEAAKALRAAGHTVEIHIDDHWRPAAVREAERGERAGDRTERLNKRAGVAAARSQAAWNTSHKIGERFSGGQPILRGHHSQRGAERDRDRMEALDRSSWAETDKAKYLTSRADGAAAHEAAKHDPPAIMRRIETMQAEVRRCERELADPDAGPRGRRWDTLRLEMLREDIAHQQAVLAEHAETGSFVAWGPEHFRKGDRARIRGDWYPVRRVNQKSLSVPSMLVTMDTGRESEHSRPVPWDEISGRRRDGWQLDTPNGEPWPEETARKVARWARLLIPRYTNAEERRHVEAAQRIARGLPVTAAASELAAFPQPKEVDAQRTLAVLCLAVYERLAAGERSSEVAADVTPFGGPAATWTMPAGEPEDRRIDQLQPGDVIAGVHDRWFGAKRLLRNFCGPVATVSDVRHRHEAGDWRTVTLTNGQSHEFQTYQWFSVHPTETTAADSAATTPTPAATSPAGAGPAPVKAGDAPEPTPAPTPAGAGDQTRPQPTSAAGLLALLRSGGWGAAVAAMRASA